MTVPSGSLVERIIDLALDEDMPHGDCTSEILIDPNQRATGTVLGKEQMVVCGLPLIAEIFSRARCSASVQFLKRDGDSVEAGAELATIRAQAVDLLRCERVVLNFLQRLSGVATFTWKVSQAASGLTLLDTRKTNPGMRILEKYAVRIGGAKNHRASLSDLILIKNNHIDLLNGDFAVIGRKLAERSSPYAPIEIEVRTFEELEEAVPLRPSIVMLDNMGDELIKKALALVSERLPEASVEVSGGVTPERIKALQRLGVRYVSMGSLTTQARNVDISLRITAD